MMPSPLREIDPDQPKRLHTFGNPFKQDKKVLACQTYGLYFVLYYFGVKFQKASCCCVGVSNTTAEGLLANFTFFSLLTTVIKLLIFFFFF